MTKFLTLAIPAYNMEKYLGRCLDSVINETYQDLYEIILVNDGSKDNTLKIAKDYQSKYPELVHLIDKPNGGWGSAINIAMEKASGKYFKILDSDDWFDKEAFIEFLDLLKKVDVDLIATSFSFITDETKRLDVYDESLCNKNVDFRAYLKENNYNKHLPMAAIAFRTSLLQENNIKVVDKYYADIDYNLVPLVYVKNLYFSTINLYQYYIGREGQSTSLTGYNNHIKDYILVIRKIISFYRTVQNSLNDEVRKMYVKDTTIASKFAYYMLLSPIYSGKKEESKSILKELDQFIKRESLEVYKSLNQVKIRGFIPYIKIWRLFKFNILKMK